MTRIIRRRKNAETEDSDKAPDSSLMDGKAMSSHFPCSSTQPKGVPEHLSKQTKTYGLTRLLLFVCLLFSFLYFSGKPYQTWTCRFRLSCPQPPVYGFVKENYKQIKVIFERNLHLGDDVGAAFAAYVNGEKVVDLQGGFMDKERTRDYTNDTLQMLFSTSKAVAIDQGILDFDEKVATYWPEFGENEKHQVTIKDVLTHRGGVPFILPQPSLHDILDSSELASRLAAMPHYFKGEPKLAYHAFTRGWILNQVVQRAHPQRWTLGRVIEEHLVNVTGMEFHLGLDSRHFDRVSPLIAMPLAWMVFHLVVPSFLQSEPPAASFVDALFKPWSLAYKTLVASGPSLDQLWPEGYNNPILWTSEGPSYNGFSNAHSLARLAAFMANGGSLGDTHFISRSVYEKAHALTPKEYDVVSSRPLHFCTAGWGRLDDLIPGETWYGWTGAGGSMMVWNPEHRSSFAYVMNAVRFGGLGDRRAKSLLLQLVRVIKQQRGDRIAPQVTDTNI